MSIYKSNQQIVALLRGHAYAEAQWVEVRAILQLMLPGITEAFQNGSLDEARRILLLAKDAVCPIKHDGVQEMFQRLHDQIVEPESLKPNT